MLPAGSCTVVAGINVANCVAQVFLLLVFEMALFMLLIIPLPFNVKRKIFTYVSTCALESFELTDAASSPRTPSSPRFSTG